MDVVSVILVVWMFKILAEDTYHGIRGTPNPRAAARARRQRARSKSRTWTAVTNYWADLVEDAAAAATESRRLRRERKRQEPVVTQPLPPEQVDLELDEPKEESTEGIGPVEDEIGPEVTSPTPGPEPEISNVIPFPTKENGNMSDTQVTGEATGLFSAMHHAEAMNAAYEAYAASGDMFVASLQNGDVSGEAVAAALQAREHEQEAAASWQRCHEALAQQTVVRDAYVATPGAGSREFVTAE
jgi:hypothetical protein